MVNSICKGCKITGLTAANRLTVIGQTLIKASDR